MQDFPLGFEELTKSLTFLYCSHKSKKSFIQLLMLTGNKKYQELYILESPTLTKLTSETQRNILTILN